MPEGEIREMARLVGRAGLEAQIRGVESIEDYQSFRIRGKEKAVQRLPVDHEAGGRPQWGRIHVNPTREVLIPNGRSAEHQFFSNEIVMTEKLKELGVQVGVGCYLASVLSLSLLSHLLSLTHSVHSLSLSHYILLSYLSSTHNCCLHTGQEHATRLRRDLQL